MEQELRPIIAIPARSVVDSGSGFRYSGIPTTYTNAVERAGGAPVLIPLYLGEETLRAIFSRIDGLLLAGGVDVHPREFGEAMESFCGEVDTARDALELKVTRWALDQGHPIFGICRGIQMLNVAAGGSLYQDIPSQIETEVYHNYRTGDPYNLRAHAVEIDPASRVARVFGSTRIEVNSLHHQALKEIAPGLKVTGRAPDGVVEAVEADSDRFIVGVQFHPELLDDDTSMARLFEDFVDGARRHRRQRENRERRLATAG
jgi:putative glutamine amidotransferase